ncbi:MAG: hypothetical protein ACT4PO_07695 [Actinomycetota bacterium]
MRMIAASDAFVAAVAAVVVALIGAFGLVLSARMHHAFDTHNAKTPGATIHDAAQTIEAVAAVQHLHTRTLAAHGEVIDDIRERTGRVESKLDGHMEERKTFEPLISWVKDEMAKAANAPGGHENQ